MESGQITEVFSGMIGVIVQISGPILLLCMIIGVIMAVAQAVTQIHEQSIAFVMKVIVVILFLSLGGSWALGLIHDFTIGLFNIM